MSSSSIITKSLTQLGAIKENEGQFVMGIMVFEPVVIKFRDIFGGIFFFYFGMTFTFSGIPYTIGTLLWISAIAVIGKIVSGLILHYKEGCSLQDALFIGITTVPRGEFSLIIAGLVVTTMPEFQELAVVSILITSLVTTAAFWIINLTCHTLNICMMSNRLINRQKDI
ncbi:MAG: cation:proton antiporter [Candidatus Izimaplasma sp.]|nr:cation:proton antiporter [Candidatus Izimaplasma bacterium]